MQTVPERNEQYPMHFQHHLQVQLASTRGGHKLIWINRRCNQQLLETQIQVVLM